MEFFISVHQRNLHIALANVTRQFGDIVGIVDVQLYRDKIRSVPVCRGKVIIRDKVKFNKMKLTNPSSIDWLQDVHESSEELMKNHDLLFIHTISPNEIHKKIAEGLTELGEIEGTRYARS